MAIQRKVKKVGDIVYKSFSPQQVGRVVTVLPAAFPAHANPENEFDQIFYGRVEVKWLKKGNPVTPERMDDLNLLEDLIEDHQLKLERHRAILARARKEL